MIYHPCPCHQTCDDLAQQKQCDFSQCEPACSCPDDTVEMDGECVPAAECPCYHDGKVHKFGEVIQGYSNVTCEECRCGDGLIECGRKCAVSEETCRALSSTLSRDEEGCCLCSRVIATTTTSTPQPLVHTTTPVRLL